MKKTLFVLTLAATACTFSCAKKSANLPATAPTTEVTTQTVTKSVIKTLPADIPGAQIVQELAKQYKGKVVLIDFWATWCGPCRRAMTLIDEIKPELAKKGCVFVYVTGESSPADTWKQMIEKIEGDHYRLTEQQWGDMCRSLGIPGIPSYLLLGKDGKTAYDNLNEGGYPGSEVLKQQIEVALTR
ncbi:MAG: TlpA family protein disulfide reductase [Alloprevotella sp.]